MPVKDHHGHVLTGASPAAAELYQRALDAYHCYAGDAFADVKAALADSPGFVMAHVLKAHMTLVGGNTALTQMGVAAIRAAQALPATDREAGHVAALTRLMAGESRGAARILEDVAIAWPHDLLALQVGQTQDFVLGDTRMLRDRIGRARAAWSPDRPGYHAILGLHAFGLEETALYDRAEAAGREAIALEPRNNWAQHAVAHVLEMQDRRAEGVRWMRHDNTAWTEKSFFAVHNWWHCALFHLGLDQIDEVLALYDGPIYGQPSDMAFDMVDAAALLWRLKLRGGDVGARWQALADTYATQPRGLSAFDDVHATMAFVGAGREAEAGAVVAALRVAAADAGDNALASRDVGLPVACAVLAFGRGQFAEAVEALRAVRNRANAFGGSHAQRDLLDLTLIAAARADGQTALERALLAERAAAHPLAA